MNLPLEILLVMNDPAYSQSLVKALETIPKAQYNFCQVFDGDIALRKMQDQVFDLVVWDMDLPGSQHMRSIRALQKHHAETGLILIGGTDNRLFQDVIDTLSESALDCIMKFEEDPSQRDIDHLGQRLLPNIRLVSTSRNLRKIRAFSPNEPSQRRARARTSSQPMIDVVVIGISTGGPNALSKVIPLLPERLGVPILIVQHMPPTFTESMAKYLGTIGKIKIKEAESNDLVQPDTLYIAPGGKHMVVEKTDLPPGQVKIALNENPHQNGCRPSVDVLLHSVTNVYGGNALVLIMTGMGKDGAAGVAAIKKLGGYCITQTKASCVVYGMPRVIDELGLSDESVSLEDMAKRIIHLTRRETRSLKP